MKTKILLATLMAAALIACDSTSSNDATNDNGGGNNAIGLSGSLLDPSGKGIPNAKVCLKSTGAVAITDANGKVDEVRGEGVVGEQPYLRPGEGFQYTSGAILETSVGSMAGSYQMLADDGMCFEADIPPFVLSIPRTLH